MKRNLVVMLFLHYFALGAVFPVLSLLLIRDLGLSGPQAGFIIGAGALASILAPLLTYPLADRLVSSEKLLVVLNLASVGVTAAMAVSTGFWPLLTLYLLLMMTKAPSFALTNSIALRHLHVAEREFAGLRLFGTAGWIAGGVFFAFAVHPLLPHLGYRASLWLSALASLVLALWCLRLPPPAERKSSPVPPLVRPDFLSRFFAILKGHRGVFLAASLILSGLDRYYFFGVVFQVSSLGFPEQALLPLLGLGQAFEIGLMMVMGRLLVRLGFRTSFLIGALAHLARFTLLGLVGTIPAVLVGIALHGFGFAFFFSNAYVYLDTLSNKVSRTQNQLLYSFLVDGAAVIFGNMIAGAIAGGTLDPQTGSYHFSAFWMWAMGLSGATLLLLWGFFRLPRLAAAKAAQF